MVLFLSSTVEALIEVVRVVLISLISPYIATAFAVFTVLKVDLCAFNEQISIESVLDREGHHWVYTLSHSRTFQRSPKIHSRTPHAYNSFWSPCMKVFLMMEMKYYKC